MRALLSVSNKAGLIPFASALHRLGYEILSTGGTLSELTAAGIPATSVSDVTGFPEILDGRVKTLHPHIHAGLLARRDLPEHVATLNARNIAPIDVVAVNLYPFAETIAQRNVTLTDAVEQIDIGGPAMIRAAAKNFASITIVTDPADYDAVAAALQDGKIDAGYRRGLAAKAFAHVAAYDTLVADYLQDGAESFPQTLTVAGHKVSDLRYGENPQQAAAAYRHVMAGSATPGVLDATQLSGKELSFNNLLDANAAWQAIGVFDGPAVSTVKHTIPCGVALRAQLSDAFAAALAGDPVSAFGGIVALNRPVDAATAERMAEVFFEVIIAPAFDDEAQRILTRRKALRLLTMPGDGVSARAGWDIRLVSGGLFVQERDAQRDDPATWQMVTRRAPTDAEQRDLELAWEVVRHVKSNAIVLAKDRAVIGVGSGQPSRVESVNIAVRKGVDRCRGSVLASDAFFPFADGVEAAAAAGVTAIVQPGGSVRDQEAIAAADAAGVAMVFTGTRHFRH